MKILITEFMEGKSIEILKTKFDVTFDQDLSNNPSKLKKIISNFDILIVRNKTKVKKEILENTSNLKFIGRLGVGLDNIDTEYCKNNNIHVQPATGMNADSVAEYVINAALSLLKNIPIANTETQKGNWPRNSIISRELKDKTIGILGFGLIGRKVAKISKIFEANVIAYDPYVDQNIAKKFNTKLDTLENVLNNAHVISLHIPLTQETNNLINTESIKLMKKKPIIINSSRGGIINEEHLIDAYLNNQISGFALDVFQNEPVQHNILEKINPTFNCIITPHNAGVTEESNIRVSQFIADSIIEYFK
tara:strand:- start:675 stop:1595 length:921 start_codon:yes stop_codon:yes gene_type:complete